MEISKGIFAYLFLVLKIALLIDFVKFFTTLLTPIPLTMVTAGAKTSNNLTITLEK